MIVTDLRSWWQNYYVGDFFRYVGDFLNVSNRSPTSQTYHQHIWSPTSVTNIDVTQNAFPGIFNFTVGILRDEIKMQNKFRMKFARPVPNWDHDPSNCAITVPLCNALSILPPKTITRLSDSVLILTVS